MKNTILVVEDNVDLRTLLSNHLQKYGYRVLAPHDFDRTLDDFLHAEPDMVLLDINLPSFDGFYWCRQIRQYSTCPVIFISARDGDMDQIMALENGGDDYITKPLSYDLVIAKVKSHLRRAYGEYAHDQKEQVVTFHGLEFSPEKMVLTFQSHSVEVSRKEALLLKVLLERGEKVTSRERLMEKMWDTDLFVDENTLNVYMTRARKRLAEIGIEGAVETVRGAGYRMKPTWVEKP
ncbi:response regulator transcription factor [Salibacterium sp. K-3]